MEGRPLLAPRVFAGIVVILGILALVALSWWTRGVDEATRLFQLLQGVLLATMTFVWGSQVVEQANQRADGAVAGTTKLSGTALRNDEEMDFLREDLKRARAILAILIQDPTLSGKIEDAVRQVRGE